jgi:cardiolipin synthase
VDVRILVPSTSDLPLVKTLSRAGYRTLLDAGVRVFEWNGTMIHAKTAVADGRWARIGSTNLNVASWFGNRELDVVVEDAAVATQMEEMYQRDLDHATEIVLDPRDKVHAPNRPRRPRGRLLGSSSRAAAGVVRLGNTIGAALTDRRILGPVEAQLAVWGGLLMLLLSAQFAVFPGALAYPVAVLGAWGGVALFARGTKLRRASKKQPPRSVHD